MAVLQVLEHQRVAIADAPRAGEPTISGRQAAVLEKIEAGLPSRAFEWGHHSIKFSQFCGVIALGGDTIEILPKIHGKEEEPGACREVLVRMLHVARHLAPWSHGSAGLNLQKHTLLEIFILHFCDELTQQLRQGMIRRYVTRTENLPVIRGKLLINQQVRLNHSHKERVWCQHDELIVDNRPNQLIKFVLRLLLQLARGARSRRQLTELLYQFESVEDLPATVGDVDRVQLDRTTSRFEGTFRFCRWILAGLNPDVMSGKHVALALLFDMNRLFEEFVAAKLRPVAWKAGLKLRSQGPQRKMILDRDTGLEAFTMKPDISLLDERGKIAAIFDTKWKLLDFGERKLGVSQADLYQMSSYASRYGCRQLALVYPRTTGALGEGRRTLELQGTNVTVRICPVDLVAMIKRPPESLWGDALGSLLAPASV